jgi:hypothetical protein
VTNFNSLITGGGIINYNIMCLTYIFFYRAVKAQGVKSRLTAHIHHLFIKVRETDFSRRLTSAKDG